MTERTTHHHRTDDGGSLRNSSIRRSGIDFAKLRQQISISQVLREIGWEPVRPSGTQLRGPCPVHKSTHERSRIFSVNMQQNIWKCFKCDQGGNQIDLYAAVTGLPIYQACLELCEKLGIAPPWMEGEH